MKGLLVRVGIDLTKQSGQWNAPVNPETKEFAYVPILESENRQIETKYRRSYEKFFEPCKRLGKCLPPKFTSETPHLDPDFSKLTYGDIDGTDISSRKKSHRGKPILSLDEDDILVFYAGLDPVGGQTGSSGNLIYAIIGLFVIAAKPERARRGFIKENIRDNYAHTRGNYDEADILVSAKHGVSGRLERCIPIGEYRRKFIRGEIDKNSFKKYRVTRKLLDEWGDLSVTDGYIQQSARLPHFCDAEKFYEWFRNQNNRLVECNNPLATGDRT